MTFDEAEAVIRAHIETQWAAGDYAALPLVFENESPTASLAAGFIAVTVEGTFADKTIYGSTGKRLAVEGGIVFLHGFAPQGAGKAKAAAPIAALVALLELQTLTGASAGRIALEGGTPPSPVTDDQPVGTPQPGGASYRCSASVPFIVIGSR